MTPERAQKPGPMTLRDSIVGSCVGIVSTGWTLSKSPARPNRRCRQAIRRQKISNKRRRRDRRGDNTKSTMDYFFIGTSLLKIIGMIFIVILPIAACKDPAVL